MRVSIDCTPLLINSAGVKNYIYHWYRSLYKLRGSNQLSAFPWLDALGPLEHEKSVKGRFGTLSRLGPLFLLNRRPNRVLDLLGSRIDLFHTSNQVLYPPRNARLTATVHDMTTFLFPELHKSSNIQADRNFTENVIRRADALIAVSEYTRQDAIRVLNCKPDKIVTIHHGIDEAYFNARPSPDGVRAPYILFVGTIEPRKNLDRLLNAYESLGKDLRESTELLIAGASGWGAEKTLARLASGVKGVRYLGYVPEKDLPALTAGATVFAYPSLYEGFGFPVAQAMAAGVPVVTSNVSSLPEIAGDAALLIDPLSTTSLRDALSRLLLSPGLREELARRGRMQAQRFQWAECAAKSWDFFARV